MRPILFCLIFALTLGGLFYVKNGQIPLKPLLLDSLPQSSLTEESFKVVTGLNAHWQKIKSVIYPKIIVQSQGFKLESVLLYEKDKNFRMVNWSFLGKESEIGSNKDYFWFWSKRMSPPALYYAKHEDLSKTNLKTPFHPNWIMETAGIGEIPMNQTVISKYGKYVVAMYETANNAGEPITRAYLIDPLKKAIIGHYIFNQAGLPIVSAEISDFHVVGDHSFPKQMKVIWFEEGFQSDWTLDQPVVNVLIDEKNWVMPDMKEKIDLKGYSQPVKVSQVF